MFKPSLRYNTSMHLLDNDHSLFSLSLREWWKQEHEMKIGHKRNGGKKCGIQGLQTALKGISSTAKWFVVQISYQIHFTVSLYVYPVSFLCCVNCGRYHKTIKSIVWFNSVCIASCQTNKWKREMVHGLSIVVFLL